MDVFGLAELDGTEGVVELGAVGTGLLAKDIALASLGVVETLDGADDGGGTAGTGLLKVLSSSTSMGRRSTFMPISSASCMRLLLVIEGRMEVLFGVM